MRKTITTIIFCLSFFSMAFAQRDPGQAKEYATVFMKIFYKGNSLVYDQSLSQSPMATMPDGKSYIVYDLKKKYILNEKGELKNAGQMINYFASFGWELKESNIVKSKAGAKKKAAKLIIDADQYFQLLTFERVVQLGQSIQNPLSNN